MKRLGLALALAVPLAACQLVIGTYEVTGGADGGSGADDASGDGADAPPGHDGGGDGVGADASTDASPDQTTADGADGDGSAPEASCDAAACDLTDIDGCAPDCGGAVCGCVLVGSSVACVPMGSQSPGGTCTTDEECMPGYSCQGSTCKQWCATASLQCSLPPSALCEGVVGGACGSVYRYCQ